MSLIRSLSIMGDSGVVAVGVCGLVGDLQEEETHKTNSGIKGTALHHSANTGTGMCQALFQGTSVSNTDSSKRNSLHL